MRFLWCNSCSMYKLPGVKGAFENDSCPPVCVLKASFTTDLFLEASGIFNGNCFSRFL